MSRLAIQILAAIILNIIAFDAHASDVTGEVLAYACESNVPGMKREKTQKSTLGFAMCILLDGRAHYLPSFRENPIVLPAFQLKR
jgi:hypothetical protein